MKTYINEKDCYVGLFPKEWKKKFENDVSVGFVGANPNIAMDVVFEIGGVDYLSLDSLGNIVIDNYKKVYYKILRKNKERKQENKRDTDHRSIRQGWRIVTAFQRHKLPVDQVGFSLLVFRLEQKTAYILFLS